MAAKIDVPHLKAPIGRSIPVATVWWLLVVVAVIALGDSLAIVQRVGGWYAPLGTLPLLAHAALALGAGAFLIRLCVVRRSLSLEVARLHREYSAIRLHTAGVAHDMRAPMVTVNSYLELLAAGEFGALPAAARRAAEQAARASVRARVLVDSALTLNASSRADAGAAETIVDLNAVLGDVIVSLGADITRAHAQVEVGPLFQVRGTESAYYRIFENLVLNALRYAQPGVTPCVEIAATAGAFGVEVAVRDNGCGIDPRDRERVFQAYERGTNAPGAGFGIGLATVRELAAHQGGSVWVDPNVVEGTCVRARFPAGTALPLPE